jgi:Transglutaminase-like superfamily
VTPVLGPADPGRPFSRLDKARLGAEILGRYARVRLLLRRRNLPATVAAIEADLPDVPEAAAAVSLRVGIRLARPTSRLLASLPTDSRCLVRSLVLMALLARRGIASALVIAVRPGEDFAAHAWIEHGGTPLLPSGDGAYEKLLELGRQSSPRPA